MDVSKHGLWVFDRIDIERAPLTEPGVAAVVVGVGKRLIRTPGEGDGRWKDDTYEVKCRSHPDVLIAVKEILSHTDWWGVA